MMEPAADDLTALLRQSAAGFLAERHAYARTREMRDRPDGLDRATLAAMADMGWMGLRLPERLGGAGLGLRAATVLSEAFGAALLPEPFIEAGLMPAVALAEAPPSPLRERLAAGVAGGRHVAVLAVAEVLHGAGDGPIATAVERRGNRLVLNGAKPFVFGAADTVLVAATLDGRTALIAVEKDAPGLEAEHQRMTDGSLTATLRFADVAVDDNAVLLPDAAVAIRRALNEGTVAASAQLAGLGRAALDATLAYMRQREQFGQRIGSFQALQHRAVDLRLQVELAGAAWRNALRRHEDDSDAPATATAISAAKARCSDAALAIARAAIQMHGGIGFTEEADIGLFIKAALRLASFLGNGTAHRRRFHAMRTGAPA